MAYTGVIIFKDVNEKSCKLSFDGVSTQADLDNIRTIVSGKSKCAVAAQHIIDEKVLSQTAQTGEYCTIEQKAIMVMRDPDATSTRKARVVVQIPGPDDTMFEDAKDRGKRVTTAAGDVFASSLGQYIGKPNLKFVRGWLKSNRSLKKV